MQETENKPSDLPVDSKKLKLTIVFVVLTAFLMGEWAILIFTVAFLLILSHYIQTCVAPAKFNVFRRTFNGWRFIWNFIVDLTISNFVLAWDVFTPTDYHKVQLVNVPVGDLTDAELALISHRITLTPGTLSCVVSADRKILVVHSMYSYKQKEPAKSLRLPIDILKGSV